MSKAKHDELGTPIKVYKLSTKEYLLRVLIVGFLLFLCSAPFLGYIVWYDQALNTNYLYLKLCIALIVGGAGIFNLAEVPLYIAIYENGIQVKDTTKKYFSRWENLKAFEVMEKERSKIPFGVIHTHEAVDHLEEHGSNRQRYLPLNGKLPVKRNHVDTKTLLQTEFGQDLLRYAPHLFGAGEKTKHHLDDTLLDEDSPLRRQEDEDDYEQGQA